MPLISVSVQERRLLLKPSGLAVLGLLSTVFLMEGFVTPRAVCPVPCVVTVEHPVSALSHRVRAKHWLL